MVQTLRLRHAEGWAEGSQSIFEGAEDEVAAVDMVLRWQLPLRSPLFLFLRPRIFDRLLWLSGLARKLSHPSIVTPRAKGIFSVQFQSKIS